MGRIYYKDQDNQLSSFANEQGYESMCEKHSHLEGLTKISSDEADEIANPSPTQAQLMVSTRAKYDKAIQDVCAENLLNDINSARNLATLDSSPLQPIAKKITDWELAQQEIFINILNDAENGIITISKSTFESSFIQFKDT